MIPTLIALFTIATVASWTFTFLFGLRSRPWKRGNIVGKMQFSKSLCLSMTLLLTLVNRWFDYPGKLYITFGVLCLLTVALCAQVVVLLKIQKDDRKQDVQAR